MDLYTHVRTFPDPAQDTEWSEMQEQIITIGEPFFVNDFAAELLRVERVFEVEGIKLNPEDIAVKAFINIRGKDQDYIVEPIYVIKDNMAGVIPHIVNDLAVKISLLKIDPQNNSFTLGVNTSQKDWIILEAVEKPWINILWIGTLIMVVGFSIAINRRYTEFMLMRDKGQE